MATTPNTSPTEVSDAAAENKQSDQPPNTVLKEVKIFLKDMENEIKAASYWQHDFTIDRVPTAVRQLKPEAYTPQYIAIGPLHRHQIHLKPMEQQKLKLVKEFLGEAYIKPELMAPYFELMQKLEKRVRQCYSEDIKLKEHEFVRMMVVDGCFLLQLIHKWKDYSGSSSLHDDSAGSVKSKDDFFTKTMMQHIIRDLMLLENQLPFLVLEKLSSLNSRYSKPHVIYEDTRRFLENFLKPLKKPSSSSSSSRRQPDHYDETSVVLPYFTVWHLLDYARYLAVSPPYASEKTFHSRHCATELKKVAAVNFRKSHTGYFTDITFDRKEGVLEIPAIDINDHSTEPLLRNLMALEQSHKFKKKYVTAYVVFMKDLIRTTEDVELLREEKKIFGEKQIKPGEVVALFKRLLTKVTLPDDEEVYFSHVYSELEDRYANNACYCTWPKMKYRIVSKARRYWTVLKTKYFDSPWSFIAFLAATAVLFLTAAQTYASFEALKDRGN